MTEESDLNWPSDRARFSSAPFAAWIGQ